MTWIFLGAVVVWHVMSRYRAAHKRNHLMAYTMMLLLRDELAQNHREKFQSWIKQCDADSNTLFYRAGSVIQNMADGMAGNPEGPLMLAVHGWLSDCQDRTPNTQSVNARGR